MHEQGARLFHARYAHIVPAARYGLLNPSSSLIFSPSDSSVLPIVIEILARTHKVTTSHHLTTQFNSLAASSRREWRWRGRRQDESKYLLEQQRFYGSQRDFTLCYPTGCTIQSRHGRSLLVHYASGILSSSHQPCIWQGSEGPHHRSERSRFESPYLRPFILFYLWGVGDSHLCKDCGRSSRVLDGSAAMDRPNSVTFVSYFVLCYILLLHI